MHTIVLYTSAFSEVGLFDILSLLKIFDGVLMGLSSYPNLKQSIMAILASFGNLR
jgi:hypothetical protein